MWTYDVTMLSTSPITQVRLLIGDTNTMEQLLQDEEINFILSLETNIYKAGWRCCETIAAEYARWVDTQVGDLKVKASQKFEQYTHKAKQLRAQSYTHDLSPYAGGITIDDKSTQEQDPGRVPPFFARNKNEYPGTQNDNHLPAEQNEAD